MEFRYVLFREAELEQDGKYVPGVTALLEQLNEKQIEVYIIAPAATAEQVQEALQNQQLPTDDGLVIAAADETVQLALQLGLAVVAYDNPELGGEERFGAPVLLENLMDADVSLLIRWWQRKHGLPWRILETERCYLRELTLADLDDLYTLYETAGMTDYIEPLYERSEEEAYQRAYIENMYGFYGYGMWVVCERETDRLIGRAGLEHRQIGSSVELEMGYAIAKSYQNKGYAAEVCRAILSYAKEQLTYEQVNCLIDKENTASVRLVKKLGFYRMEPITEHGRDYERYVFDFNE